MLGNKLCALVVGYNVNESDFTGGLDSAETAKNKARALLECKSRVQGEGLLADCALCTDPNREHINFLQELCPRRVMFFGK